MADDDNLAGEARRRGFGVASGPCEIRLERPNLVALVRVEVWPWWPSEVRSRVMRAALEAALDELPEDCR